jgi:hypothetical protein
VLSAKIHLPDVNILPPLEKSRSRTTSHSRKNQIIPGFLAEPDDKMNLSVSALHIIFAPAAGDLSANSLAEFRVQAKKDSKGGRKVTRHLLSLSRRFLNHV